MVKVTMKVIQLELGTRWMKTVNRTEKVYPLQYEHVRCSTTNATSGYVVMHTFNDTLRILLIAKPALYDKREHEIDELW